MTTHIPSLTIPNFILGNAVTSTLLPIALGTAVGYSTRPSSTESTYLALRQPPLRPPAWVFGPVWTCLYGLMGYAAHRATSVGTPSAKHGATLYTIQLGLNLVWMPLFFGIRRPVEAAVDLVALLGVNCYLTYVWSGVDKVAAWCLTPYVAWLSFATYLNVGFGVLNDWVVPAGTEADTKKKGE